jgi:hypothetical protein
VIVGKNEHNNSINAANTIIAANNIAGYQQR